MPIVPATPPIARQTRWAILALLAAIVLIDAVGMRHLSVTYDEPRHFLYGRNILALDARRFDDSKMPISAWNAIPGALATRLLPDGPVKGALQQIDAARAMTVVFSAFVALMVFAWARELYGDNGGLLAMALYALDPNLLAHSQLVTTDVYAAGTITIAVYMYWRLMAGHGSWPRTVAVGLALGLALISKYTALALLPLFAAMAMGAYGSAVLREWREDDWARLRRRALVATTRAVVILAIALAVINVGFLFLGTGTPLDGYTFRSSVFRAIQRSAGIVGHVPLPLPYPYLEGLDWVVQRERTGEGYGNIYLLGHLHTGTGFPGYYFVATLFKTPLATLALLVAAAVGYVARRRRFRFAGNEWIILCPVLFFTLYFNFFYRAQIGMRYFLVVFPLLYVFAGSLIVQPLTRRWRWALGTALACLVASVGSYVPHLIPYVNELIPNRRLAFRVLADSNLDWGQHVWYFRQYMAAHPEAIVEPERPTAGTILVGVNMLTGVAGNPEQFRWLRDYFTPIDDIAYAVLIYRVSPEDLMRLRERASSDTGER